MLFSFCNNYSSIIHRSTDNVFKCFTLTHKSPLFFQFSTALLYFRRWRNWKEWMRIGREEGNSFGILKYSEKISNQITYVPTIVCCSDNIVPFQSCLNPGCISDWHVLCYASLAQTAWRLVGQIGQIISTPCRCLSS